MQATVFIAPLAQINKYFENQINMNHKSRDRNEHSYSHNRLTDAAYHRKFDYADHNFTPKRDSTKDHVKLKSRPNTAKTTSRASSCKPTSGNFPCRPDFVYLTDPI